jgi:hypothetical protein
MKEAKVRTLKKRSIELSDYRLFTKETGPINTLIQGVIR